MQRLKITGGCLNMKVGLKIENLHMGIIMNRQSTSSPINGFLPSCFGQIAMPIRILEILTNCSNKIGMRLYIRN